jgi:hypothetical protein
MSFTFSSVDVVARNAVSVSRDGGPILGYVRTGKRNGVPVYLWSDCNAEAAAHSHWHLIGFVTDHASVGHAVAAYCQAPAPEAAPVVEPAASVQAEARPWFVECRTLAGDVVRRHGPFAYGSADLANAYHAEECAALGHNRMRRHDDESCQRVFRFAAPAPAPVAMVAQPVQQAQGVVPLGGTYVQHSDGGIEWVPDAPAMVPQPVQQQQANAGTVDASEAPALAYESSRDVEEGELTYATPDVRLACIRRALAIGWSFDATAAATGDWPWFLHMTFNEGRCVKRDGKWRLYVETAAEALAEAGEADRFALVEHVAPYDPMEAARIAIAEPVGRANGWFVTEAQDGLWYVAAHHGDPDAEGEFETEADAWEYAAATPQDDDGCPKSDPNCIGDNGDCHDACEAPQAQHTAGPWEVVRNMGGELAPFQKATGAHLLSSESPLSLEEREANGALIGAAPDMLAALETALDAWRDQFEPADDAADSDLEISGADFVDWFASWRDQAKAAVAAVKGQDAPAMVPQQAQQQQGRDMRAASPGPAPEILDVSEILERIQAATGPAVVWTAPDAETPRVPLEPMHPTPVILLASLAGLLAVVSAFIVAISA